MSTYNKISTFFAMAALLYAATNPVAQGFFFSGFPGITFPGFPFGTTTLIVNGRVCCSTDGNCPATGAVPLVGATVNLVCPTTSATGTTDANGNFVITANLGFGNDALQCRVTLTIPVTATPPCAPLATGTGTLTATVIPVSTTGGGLFFFFGPKTITANIGPFTRA